MGYFAASDPPDSFDRIEFGRIRCQKDKYQTLLIGIEKLFECFGSVPSGIVQNQIDLSPSRLEQITNKVAERLSAESGSFLRHKLTGFQIERSEKAYFVTDRRRDNARLLSFGSPYSHQTARHGLPVTENLLDQQFKVDEPNEVWLSDNTYILTDGGRLYLTGRKDIFNREICVVVKEKRTVG